MERNFRFNVEEHMASMVNTLIDQYITSTPEYHPRPGDRVHVQRSRVVIDQVLHSLYYVDGRLALVVCYGREGTSYKTRRYEKPSWDSDDNSGGLGHHTGLNEAPPERKPAMERASAAA
jgi:hypothetical protein